MNNEYENVLYQLAKKAYKKEEVPVAAMIINNQTGKIISKAYNSRKCSKLVTDHAEIKCVIAANKRLKQRILDDCTLYVTLEPCEMCKTVLKESRIKNVYYLTNRNKTKKIYSKTEFAKIDLKAEDETKYKQLLSSFFKKRR